MRLMKTLAAAVATMGLAMSAHAAGETVLVVGGGKSGLPLVKILAEQGYKVRLSVRDKSKAAGVPAGTEVVEADLTKPATLPAALKDVSYVISTVGAGKGEPPNNAEGVDYKGVAALADAAKAAGVKRMVLMSSMNAGNPDPEAYLNKNFGMVLLWKGKGEEHLRKSGVPYVIVRPGGLKREPCEAGKDGLIFKPANATETGMICRADVGLVMTDALTNKDAVGKTVALVSDAGSKPGDWKKTWAAQPKD